MFAKRVMCLAASVKHGGFCYAGKDRATGQWVRPVSGREGHAISAYFRMVGKGDPAAVGDVLAMLLDDRIGNGYQRENYRHVERHWRRVGRFDFAEAREMVDAPASIWGRGQSTTYGRHDDLTEAQALGFDFSLCLIAVDDLVILCQDEGQGMRTRAAFSYAGVAYRLRITDPDHFSDDPGKTAIGTALLCCSLTEPYSRDDGSRHVSKLVAAIITPERLG